MKINKFYNNLYYSLYKFFESSPSKWLSEWKASLVLDTLILFLVTSILLYYNVFVDNTFNIVNSNLVMITAFVCIISNYFMFHYKDKWKIIIQINKKKDSNYINKIYWCSLIFILVSVVNFIFSFYLFYNNPI